MRRNTNRAASYHPAVKPSHSSNDSRDDDFTGGKNNSFTAIAAAAANAALLRNRAFTQTNSMFDDDSIATQSKSDIDYKIIENMVNEES